MSVGSGATQEIQGYGTSGAPTPVTFRHLEWSPDGTRLLFADQYENVVVGVLDPGSDRSLSDAVFLSDENIAPTWVGRRNDRDRAIVLLRGGRAPL